MRASPLGANRAIRTDLTTREDIVHLVDAFYVRVRADARLNPIFEGVARVDWAQHLPKMYAFWESVLFAGTGYQGHPLAVHRELARRVPLTPLEFGRWLELFNESVDALFSGPHADQAKTRASRIALVMQRHIMDDRVGELP
jgi:hemoglobin